MRGILLPTENWQRESRALNHAIQLRRPRPIGDDALLAALVRSTRTTDGERDVQVPKTFGLILHHEQAPNPNSRVTLAQDPDAEIPTQNSGDYGGVNRDDLKLLYEELRKSGGLAIPHTTAGSNEWRDIDAEFDPVVSRSPCIS